MARYIDVDELLREISFYADRPTKSAMKTIKDLAQHPADVVERKKGKWIDRSTYCVCNLCGHAEQQFNGIAGFFKPVPLHTPFCATCGAEMEETDG